jgi:hypothetical protein
MPRKIDDRPSIAFRIPQDLKDRYLKHCIDQGFSGSDAFVHLAEGFLKGIYGGSIDIKVEANPGRLSNPLPLRSKFHSKVEEVIEPPEAGVLLELISSIKVSGEDELTQEWIDAVFDSL